MKRLCHIINFYIKNSLLMSAHKQSKSSSFQARLIIETRISHMEGLEIISGSVYIWRVTQHGHKNCFLFEEHHKG